MSQRISFDSFCATEFFKYHFLCGLSLFHESLFISIFVIFITRDRDTYESLQIDPLHFLSVSLFHSALLNININVRYYYYLLFNAVFKIRYNIYSMEYIILYYSI